MPGTSKKAIFVGFFAIIVCLNGRRTVVRNHDWKSDSQLLLGALETSPRSAKVSFNAGVVLLRQDRFEDALKEFELAMAIEPEHLPADAAGGMR